MTIHPSSPTAPTIPDIVVSSTITRVKGSREKLTRCSPPCSDGSYSIAVGRWHHHATSHVVSMVHRRPHHTFRKLRTEKLGRLFITNTMMKSTQARRSMWAGWEILGNHSM